METIIKEGYAKILALFYLDKTTSIHLREIARKAKLNENSASKFLNKLEQMHYLNAKKEGNLKKYTLNYNKNTYNYLALQDLNKLEKLPNLR